MASISNNRITPATNPQLAGIVNTVPMPHGPAVAFADGTPASYDPIRGSVSFGGTPISPSYQLQAPVVPGSQADLEYQAQYQAAQAQNGSTPAANGAQPTSGSPVNGGGTATSVTGISATQGSTSGDDMAPAAGTPAQAASTAPAQAVTVSGFGRSDRSSTMKATVNGADFSFPSFKSSAKQNKAPSIQWGDGWKRVQKDGLYYMEHTNGTKAVPAIEYRITALGKGVKTVKVANGWGKKFPDGTVVVFDRNEGPYALDKNGKKRKLGLGTQKIGGVKVRIFEASVVRTLEPSGAVSVFDSRGNHGAGSPRKNVGGLVTGGGGVNQLNSAPGKAPGKGSLVAGGGVDAATSKVKALTEKARGLLEQVRSGSLDSAALAAFQSELSELPDGLRQAIGANGALGGDAAALGLVANPADNTNSPSDKTNAVDGGGTDSPVAGQRVDADAVVKLRGGDSVRLRHPAVSGLAGQSKRFGQLSLSLQNSIAKAYGSNQGAGAFPADTKIKFGAGGKVELETDSTIYKRRVRKVTGAGPGEDLALTMRPNRQPGGSLPRAKSVPFADEVKTSAKVTGSGGAGTLVAGEPTDAAPVNGAQSTPSPNAQPAPPPGAQPPPPPPGFDAEGRAGEAEVAPVDHDAPAEAPADDQLPAPVEAPAAPAAPAPAPAPAPAEVQVPAAAETPAPVENPEPVRAPERQYRRPNLRPLRDGEPGIGFVAPNTPPPR